MDPAFGDEYVLQHFALPARRDYQLRSYSAEKEATTPLSQWLPRPQFSTTRAAGAGAFRLEHEEEDPPSFDGAFFSGPLPSLVAADRVAFLNGARSYQWSEGSLPGTPQVGSSREASFREPSADADATFDDDYDEECDGIGEEPYASYFATVEASCIAEDPSTHSASFASLATRTRHTWGSRNCVSGELGLGYKLPTVRTETAARRCVSGEIARVRSGRAAAAACASSSSSASSAPASAGGDGGLVARAETGARDGDAKTPAAKAVSALGGDNNNRRRPSASIAWDALNELKIDSPAGRAAVPFMWEEAPGKARSTSKKIYSRTSSASRSRKNDHGLQDAQLGVGEFSFGSSHRYYGRLDHEKVESGRWSAAESSDINLVAPAAAKFLIEALAAAPTPTSEQKFLPVAVPFQWEEAPGKPKWEEIAAEEVDPPPLLQLPPRLALKHDQHPSNRSGAAAARAARGAPSISTRSLSAPFSVLFPDGADARHRSLNDEAARAVNPRHTIPAACRSGPLDFSSARPNKFASWRGTSGPHSGPISHVAHLGGGLPQYQSAREFACEASSEAWNESGRRGGSLRNPACSPPTSTLWCPGGSSDGGGHASHSAPSCSSAENDYRNSRAIVPFSTSQSSTSHESFELWSSGDHVVSPTSRYQSVVDFDAHGSPYLGPMKAAAAEEAKSPVRGAAIVKLCRKLKMKSKSAKSSTSSTSRPGASPTIWSPTVTATPRFFDLNGDSCHGDEFFDCPGSSASSPLQTQSAAGNDLAAATPQPLLLENAPTRLPYKILAPQDLGMVPPATECNSPGRSFAEISNCLGVPISLPRFLSRCDTAAGADPCFWVENPSWDPPTSYLEDGYRSPAYRATLELLSPSDALMAKRSGSRRSRSLKLASSSLRRTQSHLIKISNMMVEAWQSHTVRGQVTLRRPSRSYCATP